MQLTDYHARLLAHELTRRRASDDVEKLAAVLADAQVDLNPHQVEAALFAFRSPFSKGAILADEVGLGKTIEAGLLLAQKWAERRRRLLVIVPANLRKQWAQELADKFHLPSAILESRSFNDSIRGGNLNPFVQQGVVLCSYQFARSKEPYVRTTPWDLVVVDEAHRLRNVYRGTNKTASSIKASLADRPKALLTATPLQNSLLELYGLVSVIDDFAFGDVASFKARFARPASDEDYGELKERLRPLCKRTLRRQVLEYVRFTNRHAIVQEFIPSDDEQRLYDFVSSYLQRKRLYALPASQRQLVTLILRKLLASSSFAIAGTLQTMVERLDATDRGADPQPAQAEALVADVDGADELADEWDGNADVDAAPAEATKLTLEEREQLRAERDELRRYADLASSIEKNSKGAVLLTALRSGFAAAAKARGAESAPLQQKAVIFTESRRTQEYLLRLLGETEFAGRVMLFNGTNTDADSKAIYAAWLARHKGTDRVSGSPSADMRAALVDHFRDGASILIATEAAAEGINLQFCNLVINYDLPWNPQRIEQRIGRCHRYGQKYDVVVVNFVNRKNDADRRVYELLSEKFQLFSGVFGASDEVLGAIESGVDFEKRIADIYQRCRTPEQIQFEFDKLQQEMEEQIAARQRDARDKLLDNFDQEVIEKVRISAGDALSRFNERLWRLTRHVLAPYADFDDARLAFTLHTNPFPEEAIHPGPYRMAKAVEDANTYRVGHPLAQRVLALAQDIPTPCASLHFSLDGRNVAALEPLRGLSGCLSVVRLTMGAIEEEDALLFAGVTDDGAPIVESDCRRLFDLPATVGAQCEPPAAILESLQTAIGATREDRVADANARNGAWFEAENEKLERWANDKRNGLKADLDELDVALREARKRARTAPTLPEKLEWQRAVRSLEDKRDAAWRAFDAAIRDIVRQKEALLDALSQSIEARLSEFTLFTIRFDLQ